MTLNTHTHVCIIGAGPAGLLLALRLQQEGIRTVVLEKHSRADIEGTIRAGVLEQGTTEMAHALGIGGRMDQEGSQQHAIELRFDDEYHQINVYALTGRMLTCYPQHELIKDAVCAYLERGGTILFNVATIELSQLHSSQTTIRFQHHQRQMVLQSDFVAGCDGGHGITKTYIPKYRQNIFTRSYPFSWLGILIECSRPSQHLIYASHTNGFSLVSTRTPSIQRMYLQCDVRDTMATWPDERIKEELHVRLTRRNFQLHVGPIIQKGMVPIRSYVNETMHWGRLFLAGDAAHIVPPTGAKGLNLAAADVSHLSRALIQYYALHQEDLLETYAATCLERIWRVEYFSWWMTSMLHRYPESDAFQQRMQHAQMRNIVRSHSTRTHFADEYVGAPFTPDPPSVLDIAVQ